MEADPNRSHAIGVLQIHQLAPVELRVLLERRLFAPFRMHVPELLTHVRKLDPGVNQNALAMAGVNQFQLDPSTGFTAETALEAVLRQAPDVVMISDLCDGPAARLAVNAALDGRLILAGLQANDTPLALNRLCGLGVEPHRIASSIAAVLAQRLVRKLCRVCREAYEPGGAEKRRTEKLLPGVKTLYRPKGCDRCRQTGYSGRVGLFELLVPDDGLRDVLGQGAPLSEVRRTAMAAGLTTLKSDGLEKARAGITTVDEVERVVG